MAQSYRFGDVEVRPAERQLLVEGRPAAVGARAFDVLLALIDHRDRVVSKNELLDMVWPGLVVEENNLSQLISALVSRWPSRLARISSTASGIGVPPCEIGRAHV